MPEIDPPTTRESGISEAYLKTILEKLPTDHHLLNARALLALPTAGYCTQNEGTPNQVVAFLETGQVFLHRPSVTRFRHSLRRLENLGAVIDRAE